MEIGAGGIGQGLVLVDAVVENVAEIVDFSIKIIKRKGRFGG